MGRLIEWEIDEEETPWFGFPTTLLLVLGFELLEYSLPDPFPLMWRVVYGEMTFHTHSVSLGQTCVCHIHNNELSSSTVPWSYVEAAVDL